MWMAHSRQIHPQILWMINESSSFVQSEAVEYKSRVCSVFGGEQVAMHSLTMEFMLAGPFWIWSSLMYLGKG